MDKFIEKTHLGEFFAKMYEANKGKNVEVTLHINDAKIEIYKKADVTFEYIHILEETPTIDCLVESVSK